MPWAATMLPASEVEGLCWPHASMACAFCSSGSGTVRRELAKHAEPRSADRGRAGERSDHHGYHPAQAFRRKKDSSVHVAARLVREAKADGLVSAGNTGAVMTVARFVLGTLPSVDRAGAGGAFSQRQRRRFRFARCGRERGFEAGASCAVRGDGRDLLSRDIWSPAARVGLLSIGEEEIKGNELTREVYNRLKKSPREFRRQRRRRAIIFAAKWT